MKKFDKSYYTVLILLLFSGIFSWKLYFKEYTQQDTVNIHNFPKTIGEWTSEELTITEHEYDILEQKLMRYVFFMSIFLGSSTPLLFLPK